MATNKAKEQKKREVRLPVVARMMSRGGTHADMQLEVERATGQRVHKNTIINDIKELKRRWLAEEVDNVAFYVKQELKRIDEIIYELWRRWEQSCEDNQKVKLIEQLQPSESGEFIASKVERITEEIPGIGNVAIMGEIRQNLMERRKLLGLYKQSEYSADAKIAGIISDFLNSSNDK